jgi:hypothetical protein
MTSEGGFSPIAWVPDEPDCDGPVTRSENISAMLRQAAQDQGAQAATEATDEDALMSAERLKTDPEFLAQRANFDAWRKDMLSSETLLADIDDALGNDGE